jgi:hypothetical protein
MAKYIPDMILKANGTLLATSYVYIFLPSFNSMLFSLWGLISLSRMKLKSREEMP